MRPAGIFVAFLVCMSGAAAEPLRIEDLLDAPTVAPYSPAQFSPDGKLLAYVVTDNARKKTPVELADIYRAGAGWYGIASGIWIADFASGHSMQITGGTGHNWSPMWSPDGETLAFLADRSGETPLGPARLWAWDRSSGELRQISEADVREGFASLHWTPDGRSVLVTLFPADLGREAFAESLAGTTPVEGTAEGVTVRLFENDPTATPGEAPMTDQINLDVWRRDLALIDVESGQARAFTRGLRITSFVPSPDGSGVAYSVIRGREAPGQYLLDLVTQRFDGEPKTVARGIRLPLYTGAFGWSPDGRWLVYRTGGALAQDTVHVVRSDGSATRLLATNPPTKLTFFEAPPPVWDAASRNVYFVRDGDLWRAPLDGSEATAFASAPDLDLALISIRQQRLFSPDGRFGVVMTLNPATKDAGFARIDLRTGAVTPIVQEKKRYGSYGPDPTISSDGTKVVYVAEDPAHPADYWIRSGDLKTATKVSQVAPALSGTYGRAQILEWRSLDGDLQRGALVYPTSYEEGKRYPLIVKVYGGGAISDDLNLFGYAQGPTENLQLYATRGYAILLADSTINPGTPMVDLMKSVMPGINAAIEAGVADPDRIGVMGHSYGGYSTLALIAQSPRFRAAVMRAGWGNMIASYGQLAPDGTNYGLAWSEGGQGGMGGSPWEFRERYLENSPLFYLDRVDTPLLIIHGTRDDAVSVFLADEVFTALRRLGKTVTYARYEGEGHWEGGWRYPNQIDSVNRILAWFDEHLAKGSVTR